MMLGRLWRFLRRLLGRRGGPPAPAAQTGPGVAVAGPAPVRRGGYVEPQAFTAILVGMARDEQLRKHRLHIFSLSDFRRASGGKWERVSALVGMVVDRVIGSHIDPDKDLFTRLDTETAGLMMPGASRQEAGVRVAAIARDLTLQLVGTRLVEGRPPEVVAADLAVGTLVDPDGRLRPPAAVAPPAAAEVPAVAPLPEPHREILAALLAPEDAALLEPRLVPLDHQPAPPPAGAPGPAMVWGRRNGLGPPHEAQVWTLHGLDGASRPLPVMNIARSRRHGDQPGEAPAWLIERAGLADVPPVSGGDAAPGPLGEWFERQMAEQARQSAASASHMKPETSLSLLWSPVWVTNRRAIGAFQARVVRTDGGQAAPLVGIQAYRGVSPVEALALDRFTAAQAARELTDIHIGRRRVGLTIPFHWTSLAPRWQDCIRLPLEQCPAAARQRLLKIEVFGLSAGIPPHILRDLLGPLGRLGCDLLARLPLSAVELVPVIRHVKAIGVDLAELAEDEAAGEEGLYAQLHAFRQATREANVACYVWGVRHRPLIARLVADGFSLVNGPAVMADIDHPRAA